MCSKTNHIRQPSTTGHINSWITVTEYFIKETLNSDTQPVCVCFSSKVRNISWNFLFRHFEVTKRSPQTEETCKYSTATLVCVCVCVWMVPLLPRWSTVLSVTLGSSSCLSLGNYGNCPQHTVAVGLFIIKDVLRVAHCVYVFKSRWM